MKLLVYILQLIFVSVTYSNADEEYCFGDGDYIGTCMTSLKCLMKQGKYLGLCDDSFNDENSVCCYLEEDTYAYDNFIVEEYVEETYVEVDDECNIIRTKETPRRFKRVVGGSVAYDSQHPWSVAIWTKDNDICGGTLLKNGWILTAAHCLEGVSLSDLEIGIYNPQWENRTYYMPEQAISHHLYDFSSNLYVDDFYYDVALIKVSLPEEVLADLVPACVSPTQDIDNLDVKVWGWGEMGNETFPEGLHELDLFVFPNDECYYVQCSHNESECVNFNGDLMFCAGVDRETAGKDTCKGDSGKIIKTPNFN